MKRRRTISFVVAGALGLLLLLLGIWPDADPYAPAFVPVSAQPPGPYTRMDYDWGGAIPIRDDKFWIWAISSLTNRHCFFYDANQRKVTGEFLRAAPVFLNADGTRLLCQGTTLAGLLKWKLTRWLEKIPLASGLARKIIYEEAFWVLDLRDNSSKRLGSISQSMGFGSSFIPSPSGRFGYNKPSTSWGNADFFLCDIESNRFNRLKFDGQLEGWWDERYILAKDRQNNFVLFDVLTRQTNTLLSAKAISKTLTELSLTNESSDIITMPVWNGRGYDFYFALEKERNWGKSFLLKADRHGPVLRLVDRDFKFQWGGHFDPSGTRYVYEGESGAPGAGGNGAVYLRDLARNTTLTLVPPDNRGQYSLPRFCSNGVIYWRNKLLRRVDLDGKNDAPLFGPGP